jgi:hypothetical protein
VGCSTAPTTPSSASPVCSTSPGPCMHPALTWGPQPQFDSILNKQHSMILKQGLASRQPRESCCSQSALSWLADISMSSQETQSM